MRDRINAAFKTAMRDQDAASLGTLRLIRAAIQDRDIAARTEESHAGISDEEITLLLGKMIKQRNESAALYESGGRLELAEKERAEITLIRTFLPQPLTESEVGEAIEAAIAATNASGLRDMGAVMAALKAGYAGRIDFAKAGKRVKAALGG